MKKLLAIIVVVAILIIGSPYFIGRQVEKHVDATIAYINQQNQDVSIEKVSFVRHWFYSELTLKASISQAAAAQQAQANLPFALRGAMPITKPVIITLNSTINHGPLTVGENLEGKRRLEIALGYVHFAIFPKDIENINQSIDLARLAALIQEQPLFVITDKIGFMGQDKINFKSAAIHHQDEEGKIDWDGIQGKLWLDHNKSKVSAELSNSALMFEGASGQKISTSSMTLNMSHHKDANGLWVGKTTADMPSLQITNKEGGSLEIKSVNLDVNTHSQKELFEGDLSFKFADLNHNGKQYGPLVLKTTLDHLDAKALATIAQYHASNDQNRSAIANLVRQNELLTAITQLLSSQPKLKVDEFSLKTPEGLVTVKGEFGLGEQTKQTNGFLQLDPFLNSLNVALDLTLPSPLAEKATLILAGFYPTILLTNEELTNPNTSFTEEQLEERAHQRLQEWVNANLVTNSGNEYNMVFKLVGGVPTVNGVAVSMAAQVPAQITVTPPPAAMPAPAENAAPAQVTVPSDAPVPPQAVPPAQPVPAPAQKAE